MSRSLRNDLALATAALCTASFGAFIWLFLSYFSAHPTVPRPDLGLTYALNNHGSRVYVSATELTGLALLMKAFFAGMLLAIAVVPKTFTPAVPRTPRWLGYVSVAFKTDWGDSLSLRLWLVFLSSLGLYIAVIFLAGRRIVEFLVSRGVVLQI